MTKTCKNCGTSFSTTMPKKQDYCCEDCRKEARAKRMSEAEARTLAEKQTYMEEIASTMERDGYKCTVCGSTTNLRVVTKGSILATVCTSCLKNGEKS